MTERSVYFSPELVVPAFIGSIVVIAIGLYGQNLNNLAAGEIGLGTGVAMVVIHERIRIRRRRRSNTSIDNPT